MFFFLFCSWFNRVCCVGCHVPGFVRALDNLCSRRGRLYHAQDSHWLGISSTSFICGPLLCLWRVQIHNVKRDRGQVLLALEYRSVKEELLVDVIEARNLLAADVNGTSDAYAKLYLLPDPQKKTKAIFYFFYFFFQLLSRWFF